MYGNPRHRTFPLQERHAPAAARDEEIARLEPIEHSPSRFLEGRLVAQLRARQLFDLGLVGRGRGDAPEARQVVTAVHRDEEIAAPRDLAHRFEDPGRHRPVAVVGEEKGVRARPRRLDALHDPALHVVGQGRLRLAVEPDDLLPRGFVASRHDPRLHRRRSLVRHHDAVGRDPRAREETGQLLAGLVAPDDTHRRGHRSQGVDIVGGIGGPAQPHLAVREAEDEDGRFARDARGLPVKILVGDDVAHHDDALARQGGNQLAQPSQGKHQRASAHSTASRRSSATWSGFTPHASRRCSNSPRP